MPDYDHILALIHEVIDEQNELRAADRQLDKAPEAPLFGEAATLDSLGLVHLIVALEQRVEEEFDEGLPEEGCLRYRQGQ